jgi:hypothetical protein
VASDGQDSAGELDSLGKVAGHLGQRGDEKIPKAVAAEFPFRVKAMAEEPREQLLVPGQSNHAIAQVARGEHVEIAPQTAA